LIAPAGPASVTTAVCVDVADDEPLGFVAVTTARIVLPTSALCTVYVCAVAPLIAAQLFPLSSHRSQRYANDGVVSLDHVPGAAVSVCPTCAVPPIVGAAVFVGA